MEAKVIVLPKTYANSGIVNKLANDESRVLYLQNLLIEYATNGLAENSDYRALRDYFYADPTTRALLPKFVRRFKNLYVFWEYIRFKFPTYLERKKFIVEEFSLLYNYITAKPHLAERKDVDKLKDDKVHGAWSKALTEAEHNPEGAITLAIILLENSCQNILERKGITDSSHYGLYGIYQETIKALNLLRNAGDDYPKRAILAGMSELVSGLDLLNDEISAGKNNDLSPEQARLMVNIAGSIATNLLEISAKADL